MARNEPFHLPSLLRERAGKSYGRTKRARTRRALIAATASQMERIGYERLTIEGIVEEAGLARGTFYLYFSNRTEAAVAVYRAFAAMIRVRRPRRIKGRSRYESLYDINLFYVRCYRQNARILVGRQMHVQDWPGFDAYMDTLNHRWARTILRDLARFRHLPPTTVTDHRSLLAARAMIAMSDELLRKAVVLDDPTMRDMSAKDETLAEVMSIMWYRGLYGAHPSDAPPLLGEG